MADTVNRARLTRREALLLSATAGVGLAAGKSAVASDSIKTAAHQGPGNLSTPSSAVAKTQYGKVRGYLDGGVFTFKGVPYRRREPLAAGQGAQALERRVSRTGVWRELPSESAHVDGF
jgi:hypothetical protein